MSEFKPSKDFVEKVMNNVDDYERQRGLLHQRQTRPGADILIRIAVPAGGVLFGILNVLRLYYSLIAPVLSF